MFKNVKICMIIEIYKNVYFFKRNYIFIIYNYNGKLKHL